MKSFQLISLAIVAILASAKWASAAPAPQLDDATRRLSQLDKEGRKALWKAWKAEHGKKYKDGTQEDNDRFKTFNANMDDIIAHNSKPGVTYLKGINSFSDLTFADFKAKYLMPDRAVAELEQRAKGAPSLSAKPATANRRLLQTTPPLTWDWRDSGKVPPVRNQGSCGSCWAFAGIAALEVRALIDGTSTSPNLSEQQMVDCVNGAQGYWSGGCNGGYSDEVFRYTSKLFATTETAYPYTALTQTCKVAAGATPPIGAIGLTAQPGFATVAANPTAIMQAVSTTGPVVVYFNVQSSFYSYSSGVYLSSQCDASTYNHAMLVVGYNATAGIGSTQSYWIIRNSWGTWGDQGYVNVQMTNDNVGACRMYSGLMVPFATRDATSPTPSPSPSPSPRPSPSPSPSPSPKPCKGKRCAKTWA